jgi:serine phosphatase RsbU (regulator of sigma subunit)
VRPAAGASAGAPAGKSGGGARREREAGGARAGHAPAQGMGIGAKVGLVVLFAAMAMIALAVVPSLAQDGGDGGADPFEAAGLHTARAYATALGDVLAPSTSAKPAWARSFEGFAADLDKQVKGLRLDGTAKDRLSRGMVVLKAMALDPSGKQAATAVDGLLDLVTQQVNAFKGDPEDKQMLMDQREALIAFKSALAKGDPGAPASGSVGRPDRLIGAPNTPLYPVRAAWITDFRREKVLAASDATKEFPKPPDGMTDRGWGSYPATVDGVKVSVFYAPVQNAQGQATARVQLAMDPPTATAKASKGNPIGLVMIFVGAAVVAGLAWLVASSHSRPLHDLARELDRLGSSGDPGRRISAHGAEATGIARSVERMVANLKFRDQHEMADLQEVISKEQGAAAQIHQGLLPKDPPRLPGWEVETLFKPGFEVGGDHFDYFRIDDVHLGVILMDSSVRGIPAALSMAMAHAYVRSSAPGVLSPAEVLMRVNRLLAADLPQGQYVTALYVVIDTASGTAKVASAGHLPLIVYRHAIGKTAIVNPEGIALGLDVGPVFDRAITEAEIPIGVGDRIVLHTDGAVKVQDEVGTEFGEQRLYTTIKEKAPMNSQAFVNFVGSAIDAFHLQTAQNDDITISTVKRLK